jgi:hypothetical protein
MVLLQQLLILFVIFCTVVCQALIAKNATTNDNWVTLFLSKHRVIRELTCKYIFWKNHRSPKLHTVHDKSLNCSPCFSHNLYNNLAKPYVLSVHSLFPPIPACLDPPNFRRHIPNWLWNQDSQRNLKKKIMENFLKIFWRFFFQFFSMKTRSVYVYSPNATLRVA